MSFPSFLQFLWGEGGGIFEDGFFWFYMYIYAYAYGHGQVRMRVHIAQPDMARSQRGEGGGGGPRERRYAPFVRCCCLEKEKEKNTPTRFVLLGTPHQNGEGDGEAGKGTNASSLAPDFLPFFFIMSYGMVWYVTVISLHCEIRCRCRGGLDSARIEKEKGEGGSQIRREGI